MLNASQAVNSTASSVERTSLSGISGFHPELCTFETSGLTVSSGYYTIANLNDKIYVAPGANVTLLLTGDATAGYIRVGSVSPLSGTLTVYMDGGTFTLSGNDIVDSGNALNFAYYGTTNNTTLKFTGNASFTDTIYASTADFTIGGGGATPYDFVGSSVTKSATLKGHFNFHYDENLSKHGPRSGFVASSWHEL